MCIRDRGVGEGGGVGGESGQGAVGSEGQAVPGATAAGEAQVVDVAGLRAARPLRREVVPGDLLSGCDGSGGDQDEAKFASHCPDLCSSVVVGAEVLGGAGEGAKWVASR
eukprot:3243825-Rhodomonas_salina.3